MTQPKYTVTVTGVPLVESTSKLNGRSSRVKSYPNGSILDAYDIVTSGSGDVYVRISDTGKTPEWISLNGKDRVTPQIVVSEIKSDKDSTEKLADAVKLLAKSQTIQPGDPLITALYAHTQALLTLADAIKFSPPKI